MQQTTTTTTSNSRLVGHENGGLWFCDTAPFLNEYLAPLASFTKSGRLRKGALDISIHADDGVVNAFVHRGIIGVHVKRDAPNALLRFYVPGDIKGAGLTWIQSQDTFLEAIASLMREARATRELKWETLMAANEAIFRLTNVPKGSPMRFETVLSREETPGWFAGTDLPRRWRLEDWGELKTGLARYSAFQRTVQELRQFACDLGVALARSGIEDYLKNLLGLDPDVELVLATRPEN